VLYVGPEQGIPAELPLLAGDIVHNLNSVLDYLWSGLARTIDPDLASKINFPRGETLQSLESRFLDPKGLQLRIMQAFPQARSFVLETVLPYKRADGLIWSLNKLDNISKHRLLITTTNVIRFKNGFVAKSQDGSSFNHAGGIELKSSGPCLTVAFSTPFEVCGDPEPTIGVIFDEPDHFRGEPFVETLIKLADAVTDTVTAFENAFAPAITS
jgi:hypothetical protein